MAGGGELCSGRNPASLGHEGKGKFGGSEEEAYANL